LLIEEYFLHLERLLTLCPQVERVTLTKEKRAPHIGFVKGEIVFAGGTQLFMMEFVHTEPGVCKTKYRYHCQDAMGHPLFRYDNAPHHHTETFPDHKHTFSSSAREAVIAAHPPTIEALLEEIIGLEAKG
jgi:Family of unknown function (DUF6516)